MSIYRTPGIYIEEQSVTGPIVGVGTSTAAFIGPAKQGLINTPVKVTNWTQFVNLFGDFITQPRHYMAYAVRGFFENSGTVSYVVRVSNARRAHLELDDRGAPAGKAIRVEAREEGAAGSQIRAEIQDSQIVAPGNNAIVKARARIAGAQNDTITLETPAHVDRFRVGDRVVIEGQAQDVQVTRIRGDQLVVQPNLNTPAGAGGYVRIADLAKGQRSLRIDNSAGIEAGSVLHLAQTAAPNQSEDVAVAAISNSRVMLDGAGLANDYAMAQADPNIQVTTLEFTMIITHQLGGPVENYTTLSMDPRHPRYFARAINSPRVTVSLPATPSIQPPPNNRPAVVAATALNPGVDENLATINFNDYQSALRELEKIDDVNLVCIPDRSDSNMHAEIVSHCERMGDRFGILDVDRGLPPFAPAPNPSALTQRAAAESRRGYAALYYPWIVINDPASLTGEERIVVPPSGFVAGVYARSDALPPPGGGVHKAPANELIRGAIDLELRLNDIEQGEINVEGVNALRIFPGQSQPIIWGARTTAPTDQAAWRYINVRRLMLYIEESIQEGIRPSIFEPNTELLWKGLRRQISQFLTRVWRAGALFGATADQAFYVKIDDELNPPDVRELGQLIIEIGVAPVRPAEFIIVRIGLWDRGAEVTEV